MRRRGIGGGEEKRRKNIFTHIITHFTLLFVSEKVHPCIASYLQFLVYLLWIPRQIAADTMVAACFPCQRPYTAENHDWMNAPEFMFHHLRVVKRDYNCTRNLSRLLLSDVRRTHFVFFRYTSKQKPHARRTRSDLYFDPVEESSLASTR